MISDNCNNFVGTEKELRELVNALDKKKIQESTVNRGVVWNFNPPLAPHLNGLREVLIKAAKRSKVDVLNNADLKDEELLTAMVGAEGLMNSRPITYPNVDDPEPLTPNHFLFNQVGGQFAPESVDTELYNPRVRWLHVQGVLNNADLKDEELLTAMVGAEGLMNSRPITYPNVDDPEPLTPNHFLFNQVGGQFAPESVDTELYNPRVRWLHVQEIVHQFWRRWLREWLPSLSPRKKWGKERRDLQVGELVPVLSTDIPRSKWPMGRIVYLFPGPDGYVRAVDVRVKVLRRPIVKLCPLECSA